mmetsp:Transcript_254/g.354  ORF Transcript_254/g.354 Transcript_254/m.354 type:complete len:117 (+) Transcript_254:122-472(+)
MVQHYPGKVSTTSSTNVQKTNSSRYSSTFFKNLDTLLVSNLIRLDMVVILVVILIIIVIVTPILQPPFNELISSKGCSRHWNHFQGSWQVALEEAADTLGGKDDTEGLQHAGVHLR